MVSQLTTSGNGKGDATHALTERLRGLRAHLAANIRGQSHVMDRVCSVLVRGELGLANPRRPKGSFLFVGPTGVGKTETTLIFTSYLFQGAQPIRFDMSEYQNQSSVEKLIGAHATDAGLMGRALASVKSGTLLFDEVEKAHPLVLDLLLQILEDGRITLATGETLNLRGFYAVLTSNIGSAEAMRMIASSFSSIERTVMARVGQQLRPELVGRITEKIVFNRLDYETQREISELNLIRDEVARLHALGHALEVTPEAVEFLIREGFHKTLGARPMRGTVERYLQEAIAERVIAGGVSSGQLVVSDGQVRLVLR